MKHFFILLSGLMLSGACSTVESISISQIPPESVRKQKISSSASNFVFLAIPFGNSFVAKAREDLERQCPGGAIEGILSKHQNTQFFPAIASKQSVIMEGYCITGLKKG